MKENKFLRINWFCVGTLLVIPLIFLKFWMWPPTTEIIVLCVFVSLNFLLFGVTNNTINQNGLKRTNYFFGFTIRKIDWNKIKCFAQVNEEWMGSHAVHNEDCVWFIGFDDILCFRIVAKNKTDLNLIISEANNYKEKYEKILKYNDPVNTIYRLRKVRYDRIKL